MILLSSLLWRSGEREAQVDSDATGGQYYKNFFTTIYAFVLTIENINAWPPVKLFTQFVILTIGVVTM